MLPYDQYTRPKLLIRQAPVTAQDVRTVSMIVEEFMNSPTNLKYHDKAPVDIKAMCEVIARLHATVAALHQYASYTREQLGSFGNVRIENDLTYGVACAHASACSLETKIADLRYSILRRWSELGRETVEERGKPEGGVPNEPL